jgi:hypothetical protein
MRAHLEKRRPRQNLRTWFDVLKTVRINKLYSVIRKWTMKRDNVTGTKQLLQILQLFRSHRKHPPALALFPLQSPYLTKA